MGGRYTIIVAPPDTYCYQHDQSRSEERKRNASKGGKSRGAPKEIADLKNQLKGTNLKSSQMASSQAR